eukprot:6212518-Pleurochrysis_carterae.AAC.17
MSSLLVQQRAAQLMAKAHASISISHSCTWYSYLRWLPWGADAGTWCWIGSVHAVRRVRWRRGAAIGHRTWLPRTRVGRAGGPTCTLEAK